MSEAHSNIGASSAHRWMNCPGSVRLYDQLTVRRTTEYAATGTAAHEVCERCLRDGLEPLSFLGQKLKVGDFDVEVTETMVSAVNVYVGQIRLDHHRYGGKLMVEQSFSLDWLHPGMFGRNDAAIVPDQVFGTLRIYDYKNGRKLVHAENNPQCMYYALGALGRDNPWMAEKVELNIIQPNAFGKEAIERWTVSVDELYQWAYDFLLPAAKRTQEPDAPCVPGEWCTFCEAAHLCRAREEAAVALLDGPTEKQPVATLPSVNSLTPERIGLLSAFFQSDEFSSWVKALAAAELSMLSQGVIIPGRKLVETTVRGNRRWISEEAVTREFGDLGGEILTTKVKSPAQIEKLLSSRGVKKADREARLEKLVTRDESTKTIVVSESDGRTAIADKKNAIELFD